MTSSDAIGAGTARRARRAAQRVLGYPEPVEAVVAPLVDDLQRFRHDLDAIAAADDHIGDRIEELSTRLDAHARQLAEVVRLQQELAARVAALDGGAAGGDASP
jgi:hypothetical protein